jgi:hypothetical protein
MYYMGFSYWECYNMAIPYRVWFLKRLQEEIKKSNNGSRAADQNTPEQRSMMDRSRQQVPAKLRRFT